MNPRKLSGATLLLISAVLFVIAYNLMSLIAMSHRHSSSAHEPWTFGRLLESTPLFVFMASFGGFAFAALRCRGWYLVVPILCLLGMVSLYIVIAFTLWTNWLDPQW